MKEKRKITIRLTSGKKELVDETKRMIQVALLSRYLASTVRVRKTIPKTKSWGYPYFEAKINVDISLKVDEQKTKLIRGF